MKKSQKILIGTVVATVAIGFMFGILGFMRGLENTKKTDIPVDISQEATEFTEKIQDFVIENIGQPIEGFNAFVYLPAFPGLQEVDFDGVETLEGIYSYENGELAFKRTKSQQITSAEEMILGEGHQTLFNNIRSRLGNDLSVDELIEELTARGIGRVIGTIFSGPTCSVQKYPPDEECADKPVFGTFIVKDIAGVNEIARFSTQRDGTFMTTLPTGEYNIESDTQLGLPGIQAYRIEVLANETSEYNIIFDTGIR